MKLELKYFKDAITIKQIKETYRELCKIHHPDLGGDLKTMQELNAEYHAVLKTRDGTCFASANGNGHEEYKYDCEAEKVAAEKLVETLTGLRGITTQKALTIDLVGVWIWVYDTSREDIEARKALKDLNYRWNKDRGVWQWGAVRKHYRGKSNMSNEEVAQKYGRTRFFSQPVLN
jgi:hypothetical protein